LSNNTSTSSGSYVVKVKLSRRRWEKS
jgi:hypothetical protein